MSGVARRWCWWRGRLVWLAGVLIGRMQRVVLLVGAAPDGSSRWSWIGCQYLTSGADSFLRWLAARAKRLMEEHGCSLACEVKKDGVR
jgi:hypothetical protein